MTIYLLDENVLRELHPTGNANVWRWYKGVSAADLRISVMTLFEKRRGWERRRKADPERAMAALAELDSLEANYAGRTVVIDAAVVKEWTRLLGAKDKNQRDRALAATARVYGFVLVTRNIADMRGCDMQVLNPFLSDPKIEMV